MLSTRTDHDHDTGTLRTATDTIARWTGLAAGGAAAYAVARADTLGVGVLCAVPVFGLCAMAGVLLGDALTPAPRGAVRTAGLAPRRIRDQVPRRLTVLLLVQGGVLVVLLAVAAALGSPDDMGRPGRSLQAACQDLREAASPWPGHYYGIPAALALAVGSAAAVLALRRIALRPGDAEWRGARARGVVASWGLLTSGMLAGTAYFAGGALYRLSCTGALGATTGGLVLAVAPAALACALWCLFTLLAPRPGGGR